MAAHFGHQAFFDSSVSEVYMKVSQGAPKFGYVEVDFQVPSSLGVMDAQSMRKRSRKTMLDGSHACQSTYTQLP